MGNQSSEMQGQYTGKPGVSMSRHFCSDLQPPTYRHHNTEGNLKVKIICIYFLVYLKMNLAKLLMNETF